MKRITFIVTLLLISLAAMAQEQLGNGLTIDKTVHNFGDIPAGFFYNWSEV